MFTLNSEYRKMEQAKLTFQNELLETLTEIHNTPNDITKRNMLSDKKHMLENIINGKTQEMDFFAHNFNNRHMLNPEPPHVPEPPRVAQGGRSKKKKSKKRKSKKRK